MSVKLRFKNNKLYSFTDRGITVISPWKPVRCWHFNGIKWQITYPQEFEKHINFYFRYRSRLTKSNIEYRPLDWVLNILNDFFTLIPEQQREVLKKYSFLRWHMLKMLDACREPALELAYNNPSLAMFLAVARYLCPEKKNNFYRKVRRVIRKRQKDILGWLGFPASKSVVKITKKIVPKSIINPQSIWYWRESFYREDVLKVLRHLKRINAGVLRICTDPSMLQIVSFNFLKQISMKKIYDLNYPIITSRLEDTLFMYDEKELKSLKIKSESHLYYLNRERRKELERNNERILFPPPPFESYETDEVIISPILDSIDLAREGREQKNCVMTYFKDIIQSDAKIYVYRMLHPERATFLIQYDYRSERYELREVKLQSNQPASDTTKQMIKQWLNRAQSNIIDGQLSLFC